MVQDRHLNRRLTMVRRQIEGRGVRDPQVLDAMRKVPRHRFVSRTLAGDAYKDHPLPIGSGQTISQPYIVALMAEAAAIEPDNRVLEVGTGSGYGAAVLAELAASVISRGAPPQAGQLGGPKSWLNWGMTTPPWCAPTGRRAIRPAPPSTQWWLPRQRPTFPQRSSTSSPTAGGWSSPWGRPRSPRISLWFVETAMRPPLSDSAP